MTSSWREHLKLRDRLHPEHPDDLQVIVHEGGPRLSDLPPELVWVTITGCEDEVFSAKVLNQPHQLISITQGQSINFVVPEDGDHAVMVTDKYIKERPDWIIHPCQNCGLTELLDAPSDLIRVTFPDAPPDAVMEAFTTFCGACGGVQVVQHKDADISEENQPNTTSDKKWWQFWR